MMWKKEKLTDCDIILAKKYINGGSCEQLLD